MNNLQLSLIVITTLIGIFTNVMFFTSLQSQITSLSGRIDLLTGKLIEMVEKLGKLEAK